MKKSAVLAGETSVKLREMLILSVTENVTKIVTKISKGKSSYDFKCHDMRHIQQFINRSFNF